MSCRFILKAMCPAKSGIVASVTGFLYDEGCYLAELHQFDDPVTGQFFMRADCEVDSKVCNAESVGLISEGFVDVAAQFDMRWEIHDTDQPTKVLIMVSKFDHCLDDLLYRHRKGELDMEITAIVSNHKTLRPIAEREGFRFIHMPITKENKVAQEKALLEIVEETETELIVLARYMQILTNDFCEKLAGKIINIHHSFLPGFKGAKPYHQAYRRGVKLIGATAHYVTSDLDEGPIIEQAVQQVDHSFAPEMLVAVGRDTETVALARAVKLHLSYRVFLNNNKTVILR